MKFSNCFLLNALVYLAVASVALQGKEANFYSAAKNTNTTKIVEKANAESNNSQDFKNDLLFRF